MSRARAESFGAWVRTADDTMLALDRARATSLGIEGGALWAGVQPPSIDVDLVAPIEAHVAVTSRCALACEGCYLDARVDGAHVGVDALERTLASLSAAGVFTVAFGGGEPLSHPSLGALGERARAHGLTPVTTTSGLGMTREKARALRSFAQVNVSHDGVGGAYSATRGIDGASMAERAIALLVEEGVAVGVNLVLTRPSFSLVEAWCERVADLGAREVQLLRYKPAGRAASLEYLEKRLDRAQVAEVPALLRQLVARGRVSVRIDCAMVPYLAGAFDDPNALLALGVMGCEAANALSAVRTDGRLAPCSFLPAIDVPLARLTEAWRGDDEDVRRWRSPTRDEAPCSTCPIARVCRGGCRAVAAHVVGDPLAADPECPRVVAHREGAP